MSQRTVPDQSLADLRRRVWARKVWPHMLTITCPMKCKGGLMTFTGRSYQDGMGPLVNIHECDKCGAREDIANDYYPRIEYRNEEGRPINLRNGKAELR